MSFEKDEKVLINPNIVPPQRAIVVREAIDNQPCAAGGKMYLLEVMLCECCLRPMEYHVH